jgi:hypothetical protein
MRDQFTASQRHHSCDRRSFLQQSAVWGGAILGGASLLQAAPATTKLPRKGHRPKIACLFTEFRPLSHAHVVVENFLEKYPFNGEMIDPGVDIVSFWGDQFGQNDMSRQISRDYKIPIFKTIDEALCLGGKNLAVDAVLAIGEHGNYPLDREWVTKYPRKRFFDESVAVMRRSGRVVPYFNDKHLCYRWDLAKKMYDTAREMKMPLMAGSSVPLAQRVPSLELPDGAEIAEAMMIHGGQFENYGIHAVETLQSIVESRKGGETGISQIEVLYDEELWKGARAGKWPFELAAAAMELELGKPYTLTTKLPDPITYKSWARREPHGLLINYKDGTKGYVIKLGANSLRWNFACRLKGEKEIRATQFYPGPWKLRNLFRALCHAVQHFFIHGEAPYPVERALMANGTILAAVDAYHQRGKPLATPHLEFAYEPRDFRAFRENGATWKKLLPEGTPEPKGIAPLTQAR